MTHLRTLAPLAALLLAALVSPAAQAACYIVHGADQQVIYRAQTPPVDMSRPLHETLPRVAPGGALVFSLDSSACEQEVHLLLAPGAGASARVALAPAGPGARAPRAPRN